MVWQKPYLLPLLVSLLLPATFFITYVISISLGHVEVEVPYISDTGAYTPESSIFAQLLNLCSLFVGLTMYIRFMQIQHYLRNHLSFGSRKMFTLNRIALVCGLISSLGLSFVANFRESELYDIHLFGASVAFGFGALYCWLQTCISFKIHPLVDNKGMALFRLLLSIVMTVTFITTCACGRLANKYFRGKDPYKWKATDGGYALHLTSTVCEWTTAAALDVFIMTYCRELMKISIIKPKVIYIEVNISQLSDTSSTSSRSLAIHFPSI